MSDSQTLTTDQIAAQQDAKENERRTAQPPEQREEEAAAAQMIQKNYRGYRERRQLKGFGLDPSTRWIEAVKEAQYRNVTRPLTQKRPVVPSRETSMDRSRRSSDLAKQNWKRAGQIARRAAGEDTSDSDGDPDMTDEQREAYRKKKAQAKKEREKTAKMMDLQYFLEMVDSKHRYGSHLRTYHEEWKRADTHENFFYWLDHGEGKNISLPTVSREKLDKDQVRYLSREERLQYLVKIDREGRLRWAKNNEKISTSAEYVDSRNGIVRTEEKSPTWRPNSSSSDSSLSYGSEEDPGEGRHYANHDLENAKGLKKVKHVSPATILNQLLQKTVKPGTWIYVADTSFRLYVGIKQSGAFQHSSFLHGARIASAGLIKIKDGQLRSLSPLSGHYRPPTKNFRAFVHSLEDAGVDMSRVSISKAYAVLVGLETYTKTRKKFKHSIQHMSDMREKVLHPGEYHQKQEAMKDKSKSAEKERQMLAAKAEAEAKVKRENSLSLKLMQSLNLRPKADEQVDAGAEQTAEDVLTKPGQDAESGIAPAGKR